MSQLPLLTGWENELRLVLVPATAFVLTLLLIPLVSRLAIRWGRVAQPRADRWHKRPTPTMGGVAFFCSFFCVAVIAVPQPSASLPFFLITLYMFVVGVYDDLRPINPATKLIGQIIAAAAAIFCGYTLQFFPWPPLDMLITVIWIVGLINAINLLDNMDGLAGGIGLIAAFALAFLFLFRVHSDIQHGLLALALAGALGAFLVYNFHPASIFMGNAGSLFLGSSLSLLSIHTHGQTSNMLSLVAVPVCLLLVPILDTTLVALTRMLHGRPVFQGNIDHTSHRLVVLGLSEREAVLLLYLMAMISGVVAVLVEHFSYTLSLALVPTVVLVLALFTAYLAQIEFVSTAEAKKRVQESTLPALLFSLTYKRRLLEVLLDLFLIVFTYYLAFALRYDFSLDGRSMKLYLTSLPLVLTATYVSFFFFGVYRGLWRYTGLDDLLPLGKGVIGGAILAAGVLLMVYRFTGYSRVVLILYALLLLLAVAATRLSFRFFALLVGRPRTETVPILIYGAGDGGEAVIRECRNNPRLAYRPVGFLDDDVRKVGRTIFGVPVLGGIEQLPALLQERGIQGCIISSPDIVSNGTPDKVRTLCRQHGVWIKRLRLDFVEEEEEREWIERLRLELVEGAVVQGK